MSVNTIRCVLFMFSTIRRYTSQIRFLPGNRTADHVFTLRTLYDKYVTNTNRGQLYACFVDFRKAFDSIWYQGLFNKLTLSLRRGGVVATHPPFRIFPRTIFVFLLRLPYGQFTYPLFRYPCICEKIFQIFLP